MSQETCPKVTLIIIDIIIFALGISTIVVNAVEAYSSYYYYPSAILMIIMIFGIIGACVRIRGLLMASAIMCWVYAGVELANIIVVWIGYAACAVDSNPGVCYIYMIIGMTIIFCIGMLLLVLSGICAFRLSRLIGLANNGGINVLISTERAEPLT